MLDFTVSNSQPRALTDFGSRLGYLLLSTTFPLISIGVSTAQAQDEATPVTVTRVIAQELNQGQRAIGSVRPLRSSTIGSAADGRVKEFLVNRGEAVTKGQELAQLRTETLDIELAAAEAELKLYQQQLLELENGSREEDIEQARANLEVARVTMNNAANQLARAESLSVLRAASNAELDDAKAAANRTKNVLAATEASLKRLLAGPRPEQIAQAAASVELQQQRVALIRDRKDKHTIRAPFDGFVANEFTEVGAWVTRGDPVVQVIQLSHVEIEVPATAAYALRLSRGETVRVEFPELPEKVFFGEIDHVVPQGDSRTRTYPVIVRMKNDFRDGAPLLMAGMLARVELPAGKRARHPLVPKDSLVLNGRSRSVFVVEFEDASVDLPSAIGTARKRAVALGVASGGAIQLTNGVTENEVVVVVGNERLVDGDTVRVVGVKEPPISQAAVADN